MFPLQRAFQSNCVVAKVHKQNVSRGRGEEEDDTGDQLCYGNANSLHSGILYG